MTKDNIKILLFKVGAIGDVLMTTPFLRQLRSYYPDARIDYLVGHSASQALEGNLNLDEVITFDENIFFKKKPFAYLGLIRTVRQKKYDLVFVLDKHLIFNVTAWMFCIPCRIGFDRMAKEGFFLTKKVFFDGTRHEIWYYLDLLKAYGKPADYQDVRPDITVLKADKDYAAHIWNRYRLRQKHVVVIAAGGGKNPGQSTSLKIWPKERFLALIKELLKHSAVILIGDKHDAEVSRYLIGNLNNPAFLINQTGKTTVKQAACLMQKAHCCITNDTGPMHIASAVNPRVISLFGPTDPSRFAPLAKTSISLIKRSIGCPCYDVYGSFKRCNDKGCMQRIAVEDVLRCERLINRTKVVRKIRLKR